MEAGVHTAVWDGTNDDGGQAGSGVYWSQMKARSFVSVRKMIVLK
jgi:flagellar hook assembly protein FlgD